MSCRSILARRKEHQLRGVSSGLTMMVPFGGGNSLLLEKLKAGNITSRHGHDKNWLREIARTPTSTLGPVLTNQL
eukprot:15613161-Heterocapsa_arctica.AAC.1